MSEQAGESKVPEQELRESESKYRFLFENLTDGFAYHKALFDGQGKPVDYIYLEVNDAFEKMTGLKKENVVGKRVTEVIPGIEHDKGGWIETYGRVALTKEPIKFESYSEALRRWFSVAAYSPGTPYFATVFEDITERKQAERVVQEDREYAESIIATVREPLVVLDTDLRVVSASRAFHQAFRVKEEETYGQLIYELGNQQWNIPGLRELLETILPKNTTFADFEVEHDFPHIGRRIMLVNGRRLYRETNRTEMILLAIEDITERKQAERELTRDLDAMRRLHKLGALSAKEGSLEPVLTEIVDAAIAISGAAFGNIQILDPKTSRLQIMGQHGFPKWWIDFWSGVSEGHGVCGTALERRERVIVEDIEQSPIFVGTPALEIQLKAGVRAVQSTPLVSRSGKLLGMFSTHYKRPHRPDDRALGLLDLLARQAADIIEGAQIEEALRRSRDELELRVNERTSELAVSNEALLDYASKLKRLNEELQSFTSAAAHDLQEPLRKIQTFCDLAIKSGEHTLDSTRMEYMNRVVGSASRMRQLLRDMLEFSRVITKPVSLSEIDLGKTVREGAALFEDDVRRSGGLIEFQDMPHVEADETQMLSLFQNLIGNALKYRSKEPPQIKIYAKQDGGRCEIFVEDNGIGFEQQYAKQIFKPFQRLHGREEHEGTGMGLAICYKITQRHGGSIRAESEPGKGSRFIVELPLRQGRGEIV